MATISPKVHTVFDPVTGTWQYIVADPVTHEAAIIDSVLDLDPGSSCLSTTSADHLLDIISKEQLKVTHVMETHAHADHLTASRYLQQSLVKQGNPKPAICIGERISIVQETFAVKYGVEKGELINVFDKLWEEAEWNWRWFWLLCAYWPRGTSC